MTSMMQKKNERYLHKEWTTNAVEYFFPSQIEQSATEVQRQFGKGTLPGREREKKKYRTRRAIKKQ